MNELEFVEKLRQIAPVKEDFKIFDVSDDFIQQIIAMYTCLPKKVSNVIELKNPLISLVNYYDCSCVEIASIKFNKNVIENSEFYQIGYVDADILALNKVTLTVQVLDYTNTNHVIWECASTGENFLEAILICSEYLILNLKNAIDDNNNSIVSEYLHRTVEAAGGELYMDFYKVLLGI